jgi:hypothetical protein
VRLLRVLVPVSTVLAALLLLAPVAVAAPAATASIRGLEYSATSTEGRFGGTARGQLRGVWTAVVVHDRLEGEEPVPINGGSFTLYTSERPISGTFVRGTVKPLDTPSTCRNERFDVTGTLKLRGGGSGSFAVVLTHLRAPNQSGCTTYCATVVGDLTTRSRAAAQ